MTECWKPIEGYTDCYEVSDCGRVRRILQTKGTQCGVIKPWPDSAGRLRVYLSRHNVRKVKVVARLVARAFLGPSELEVNHKDANVTNNWLSNLEYTTRKENAAHAACLGLMAHGEDQHLAKLTSARVIEARKLAASGVTQADIAKRFGVVPSTIGFVLAGKTWRHV